MPTLAVVIAILTALVSFWTFLSGPGDRRLKRALVDFYAAMEAGDWTLVSVLIKLIWAHAALPVCCSSSATTSACACFHHSLIT